MPPSGDLVAGDGVAWSATFDPSIVHPELGEGGRLAAERTRGRRCEVLGRNGTAIVGDQPLGEVGAQPSRAGDVGALAASLAGALDVDGAELAERVRAAPPDVFVPVITLRRAAYEAVRAEVQPLAGTVFRESTLPLAPSREFARAVLGSVGAVTAEQVEASEGWLAAGDIAGLSGLLGQYDEHLGGTAGVTVNLVFEDFALGPVPFSTDFARSCNTAFVGLSSRLEPGALREAGASVGLGGDWWRGGGGRPRSRSRPPGGGSARPGSRCWPSPWPRWSSSSAASSAPHRPSATPGRGPGRPPPAPSGWR